jgi:hypothetical protein
MTKKLGLLGLLALAAFIFGNFYIQLTNGPARTIKTRLESLGEISVHLETRPDPPKPGGIPLIVHITDQNDKPVLVDQVEYEYAQKGESPHPLTGKLTADGSFQATASITDVGEWEVRVILFKGNQQTQVQFVLNVGANI